MNNSNVSFAMNPLKKLMKIRSRAFFRVFITVIFLTTPGCCLSGQKTNNYLEFATPEDLQEFFRYEENAEIIVSGHRGGREKHFPENSIEGLQKVLGHMQAIFEIDPRLTKDSIIVLMHDETLDRTTTATGKLSEYTWEELRNVRLKDSEGNVTPYRIPTLEEVIKWSRGKTVINLDKKDVPAKMIAGLIKKYNAETHVMLTVHTGAQARYYYDRFPGIMLSVFSRNDKEYEDIAISGVPWKNMIAYVGPAINESNADIVRKLRERGVKCMVSFAPSYDKLLMSEERNAAYKEGLKTKPDIIESDLPVEVWAVIHND